MYGDNKLEELIGRRIRRVHISDDYLRFVTDQGDLAFTVEGDCCSTSYFYDFIGLDKLLKGPVLEVAAVPLSEGDPRGDVPNDDYEVIECYGYKIVTDDPAFGPVTTVFSFRNSSNGYYGGWMESVDPGVCLHVGELRKDALNSDDFPSEAINAA